MHKDKNIYDLIVVGGGASGMMAAGRAAELGARVLLMERNSKLGVKLGISGGGRCNITNAEEDMHQLLSHYGDAKDFLYSSFSQFGLKETFDFFEQKGLPLVVQARKRAFPNTERAEDVVKVMTDYVKRPNIEIHMKTKVKVVRKDSEGVFEVETKKGKVFRAEKLALATGGLAAPETGSSGDGFSFAQSLGHTVVEPSPNIVPLVTDQEWVHRLAGVSLSFMKLSFYQDKKVKIKKTGKILFTHFGISGPLVLNSSKEVVDLLHAGPVEASIDMFPDTDHGELDKRIVKLFDQNKNKYVKNIFGEILPKNMVLAVLNLPHLDLADREVNSITKEERSALVHTIKDLRFEIIGTLGYEDAVIADGGIVLEEVDTKSFESKKVPGLYLLGDVLHINRPSGGYSLQMCWTTGFVAGSAIGNATQK